MPPTTTPTPTPTLPPPTDALVDVIALEEALQRRAAATSRARARPSGATSWDGSPRRRCRRPCSSACAPRCSSRRSPRAAKPLRTSGQHPELRQHADVKALVELRRRAPPRRLGCVARPRPSHSADELSVADVGVDETGAVGDFAAELSRYAGAATARDAAAVRVPGTTLCLQAAALRIGTLWPRDVEDGGVAAAARMERLLYEQSLMERTAWRSAPQWSRRLPFRTLIHTVIFLDVYWTS